MSAAVAFQWLSISFGMIHLFMADTRYNVSLSTVEEMCLRLIEKMICIRATAKRFTTTKKYSNTIRFTASIHNSQQTKMIQTQEVHLNK